MKSDDMSLSDDSHDMSLAHGKGSSQDKHSSQMGITVLPGTMFVTVQCMNH